MKITDVIQRSYEKAEELMTHLPDGADLNTVAEMYFNHLKLERRREKVKDPLPADIEATLKFIDSLYEPVEMTGSQFTKAILRSNDFDRSVVLRFTNCLRFLGFKTYHNGNKRLFIIDPNQL